MVSWDRLALGFCRGLWWVLPAGQDFAARLDFLACDDSLQPAILNKLQTRFALRVV